MGFWIAFILAFTILLGSKFGYLESLKDVSLEALVYAAMVYTNLYLLIPATLAKRKYQSYFTLLLLLVLFFIPIHAGVEYFNYYSDVGFKESGEWLRLFGLSFINLLFMLGMTTGLHLGTEWYKQQQEKQELEQENLRSELQFLRSQINPHFLFNTLNNLYSLTLKKSDHAPEMVLKISEIMRYMLYDSNERLVPLQKELTYIENYIALQEIRQGANTKIEMNINGHANGHLIAPLLFIPFLENSFKHGVDKSADESWVKIDLNIEGDELDLIVANNKPLKNGQPKSTSGGIGLTNVKRRLELLYPERYDLFIDEQENTYTTSLKLLLK